MIPNSPTVVLKRLAAEGVTVREGAKVDRIERRGAAASRFSYSQAGAIRYRRGHHICLSPPAASPTSTTLGPRGRAIAYTQRGITVNKAPEDFQSPGLRHRRRHWRPPVHACRQLSCRHRHPSGPVPASRPRSTTASCRGSLHPARTCPGRPFRGSSTQGSIGKINVLRWPYHENDRAQAERVTEGHVKVVTDPQGLYPRRRHRRRACRRGHSDVVTRHLPGAQDQGRDGMDRALSDALGEINKRAAYRYYANAAASPMVRRSDRLREAGSAEAAYRGRRRPLSSHAPVGAPMCYP